jgi:hypothetical protein
MPETNRLPADVAALRARHAALARYRPADDPALVEARRDLRAARLQHAVSEAVAAAPPLTGEQRRRIAALLTGGGARG